VKSSAPVGSPRAPGRLGAIALIAALGIALTLYLFGMEVGDLRVPPLAGGTNPILRIAGPVVLFSLAALFVPLLPKSPRFASSGKDDATLLFSAVRVSRYDDYWTANSARHSTAKLKRAGNYPFSRPCAHRLTCWRGILLNAGADPVLDITVINRSTEAFLVAKVGIEIVGIGRIPERRDVLGASAPVSIPVRDCYAVETPETLQLFREAHRRCGNRDIFALDTSLAQATDLSEPFYLRPAKSFRFELRLLGFCERTPLHALVKLVLHTDGGAFQSPAIYFRH
jgi:hypothetical protein